MSVYQETTSRPVDPHGITSKTAMLLILVAVVGLACFFSYPERLEVLGLDRHDSDDGDVPPPASHSVNTPHDSSSSSSSDDHLGHEAGTKHSTAPPSVRNAHLPFIEDIRDENMNNATCYKECMEQHALQPHAVLSTNECAKGHWWCADQHTLSQMAPACAKICSNQFPTSCTQARYLILTYDWYAGLGSALHIRLFFCFPIISCP